MPKYAGFDPSVPDPKPVDGHGWWDTDEYDYGANLPPTSHLLRLTDAEWEARSRGIYAVSGGKLVPYTPPPPPAPTRWDVPKLLVIDRIGAAGKLRDARAALKMGHPDADLTDAELLLRDRWDAARIIASDDPQMRGLLAAIGCDADAVLAAP